jgi:CarboxypepD_reg-like domain
MQKFINRVNQFHSFRSFLNLHLFSLLLFFVASEGNLLSAQGNTQVIRGTLIDKDTREPLIGAVIKVVNSNPVMGTSTDMEGQFVLSAVPLGRCQLQCSYLGYGDWLSDPLIVNSTREITLAIEMVSVAIEGQEVQIVAKKFGNEPLNELSILSARSFSADETQRYAASANDPGRMAQGFPGVQPSRDNRSDIIVRGNSGIGLLWRLEGIDIPNPNHFARRGSSGGGITVFSVSMLGNSDFSTGAFPAEYGNAYSGVFDIRLRKGNVEKRQYTFRAGLLGLDFSTEGPLKKGGRSSYLLNYRYSTLGILNNLGLYLVGERVNNTFQDLSFNLNFPSKNGNRTLSVWGIGGLSSEIESPVQDTSAWDQYTDYLGGDFITNMGAMGATFTQQIGDNAYMKTNLAVMGQDVLFTDDTFSRRDIRQKFSTNIEDYREGRGVLSSFYNRKLNDRLTFRVGAFANLIRYNLSRKTIDDSTDISAKGQTTLLQPYAQLRIRATERLSVNLGAHAMWLALNQQHSVEPRVGVKYQINEQQTLSLGWGIHSRMLPIGNYFTRINGVEVNRDANFIRTQHWVLGYDMLPGRSLRFHIEGYYQSFWDVPVAQRTGSSWSILNTIDGFARERLINEGGGHNMGIDVTIEQSFRRGAFFLLGTSLSRSRYTDAQGREFPTAFDSGLSATFQGGKEWELKRNATLQIGTKIIYNGGQRLTPLLQGQEVSRYSRNPLLDESRAFGERVAAYFRPDLRIAYRKNAPHAAWQLALDVQNVANRRNLDALTREYDPDTNNWVYRQQSGLTPILSFQIDF